MKNQEGKRLISREKKISTFEEVADHITHKKLIKLNKNEYLYRKNETIKGIHYLITGRIKVIQKEKDENFHVLYSIKAPDLIGLSSILYEEFYTNCAYSVEESNLIFIPKKDFLNVLNSNKQIAMNLMKLLCVKIGKTEGQIPQIVP
jgi:CRP/FNR family cyclic AMP-dependent transcriptional regulator